MRRERVQSQGTLAYLSSAAFVGAVLLALLPAAARYAKAQTTADNAEIRALENKLRIGAEQHAGPEQQGVLWRSLGFLYENRFDYDHAQDAYGHAIHLLRNTARKAEYADSLHQVAEILGMQGRQKEALSNLIEARAVFEEIGDRRSVASMTSSVALALLREHKYQEAEKEGSAALRLLESVEKPNHAELESTYLTRARAVAGEGHPQAALEDIARARAVVDADPRSNEFDRIAILLVQGEVQMQAGLDAEGARSMAESLKRARALSTLPPAPAALLVASILEREAISLRKAHHNNDAKVLEGERKQALTGVRAGCGGCTVSVSSLLAK